MLILVAGLTGNLGQKVGKAVLDAGHQLRGLGRNPQKLPSSLSSHLESFITSKSHEDIPALDKACVGADAIICCYAPIPILSLDGQLLLLRAAERAGIKRYHAASWNLDWSEMPLMRIESYDPYISFYYQARLTSSIKPLYVFVGVLAMTFFAVPGAGAFEKEKSLWVREEGEDRRINVIGSGEEKIDMTTEADAAAFSVALVTSEDAEKGGVFKFSSCSLTLKELKETYLKVFPEAKVQWNVVPVSVEQFGGMMEMSRKAALENGNLKDAYIDYVGFAYMYYMFNGQYLLGKLDCDKFPHVKRTSLEEYIKDSGIV